MATEIKTKFAVGDVVFLASTDTKVEKLPCPDCKGSRKWKAVSPAGAEHEINCPRCSTSYRSDQALALTYNKATPLVRALTIGSVQYRSVGHMGGPAEVTYMCRETGIGSGTVYDEKNLHATQEEAEARANVLAAERDESNIKRDQYWHGRLDISDYQLGDARAEAAKRDLSALKTNVRYAADLVREAIAEKADLKDAVNTAFAELGQEILEDA